MRHIAIFTALIMLFPAVAQAAHADNKNAVCRTVAKHKPADNVIYQPGVDVRGKAVVPADVNETKMKMPDVVKVPLTIDLARRVSSLTGQNVQMETNLGMLDIHMDGRVMYGDQDWTEEVMTLCGYSHAVVTETIVEKPPASAPAEPKPQAAAPQKQPQPKVQATVKPSPDKDVTRIITHRPDLIQGSEYRVEGIQ